MPRFAAFLRGMNLGGRRIKNPELCACFEELGLTEVGAFLASGNVVFETRKRVSSLESFLAKGLEELLGYPVPTFVRSAAEVRAIAERAPFSPAQRKGTDGRVQVALLGKRPSKSAATRALAAATDDDRLVIRDRELYWLPRGGLSDSALDLKAVERALGTVTIRTHRTIARMVAKYFH